MSRAFWAGCALLCLSFAMSAADPDKNFAGTWMLDRTASNFRQLRPPEDALTVTQNELAIEVSAGPSRWSFPLDGGDSKYQVGGERWNSATKWEGSALLINTLVMG